MPEGFEVVERSGGGVPYLPRFDAYTHFSYRLLRDYREDTEEIYGFYPRRTAWRLLKEFLDGFQQTSMLQRGVLFVNGSAGGVYAFHEDNLWYLGMREQNLMTALPLYVCLHPPEDHDFPFDDVVLARFLMIRDNEKKFRDFANFQQAYRLGAEAYLNISVELVYYGLLKRTVRAIGNRHGHHTKRETEEFKRLVDLYENHPNLLWRMAGRYFEWMDDEDQKRMIDGNYQSQIKCLEERYAG